MKARRSLRMQTAACVIAAATITFAQAQAPNPARGPQAQQLLNTQVGGTRVPRDAPSPALRNPYEGDAQSIAQGRELFRAMNCVGCHAAEGGGGMGPPLSDKTWIYGGEPAQIYLTIVQGRPNGMPSFANALPPDQVWKLVSYVRSLSHTPPDRPNQSGAP